MKYFFSEHKLVLLSPEADREYSDSILDVQTSNLAAGKTTNVESKKIADSHNVLRAKFKGVVKEGIISKKEEAYFQNRIEGPTPTSMEGMRKLANEFQRLVEQARDLVQKYEKLVNDDREFFVLDPSRTEIKDGAQKFIDEFRRDSDIDEKLKRLYSLPALVKERKNEIAELEKHGYTKEQLRKMRSSEMKTEIKELKDEKKEYEILFRANKKYFSQSTIDRYLAEMDDLTLPHCKDRIKNFKKDLLEGNPEKKGRKKLVDEFKFLQKNNFLKDPNTGSDIISENEFMNARRREKQEILKNLRPELDKRFELRINNLEDKDMAPHSKQYAIASFKLIKDTYKKAERIQFMERAIVGEQELTKKHEKIPEKDRKRVEKLIGYEKWETLTFENKQKTLEQMPQDIKALNYIESELAKGLKEGIIAEKTRKRFMDNFMNDWDFDQRQKEASVKVFGVGMKERKKEHTKFYDEKTISKEVKAKFEKEFNNASLTRRKEIVLEAQKDQQKLDAQSKDNEAEKAKAENPNIKVETKEEMLGANILILTSKANNAEESKDFQKAIIFHQAVLAIDPYNEISKKKMDKLQIMLEKQEEQKMEGEIRKAKLNQEVGRLSALQLLVEEQETVERQSQGSIDKANQDSHLNNDAFDRMMHKRLAKHGKVLGREHSGIRKAENLLTIKDNLTEVEMGALRREVIERGISDKPRVNLEIKNKEGKVQKAEHGHKIINDKSDQIKADLEIKFSTENDDKQTKDRRKLVAEKVISKRLENRM